MFVDERMCGYVLGKVNVPKPGSLSSRNPTVVTPPFEPLQSSHAERAVRFCSSAPAQSPHTENMTPQPTTQANTAADTLQSANFIQVHEAVNIEVDAVTNETTALKERIFALETTLREADKRVHTLTAENDKGVAQNLRLVQAIAQLQNTNDELTKQADDLKTSNVNLEKVNEYTLAMWKKLFSKHKKLLDKSEQQESWIEMLQTGPEQRYNKLQIEFVQSLQKHEALVEAKSKLRAENFHLTAELKCLQTKYEDVEAAYENLEDEYNRQLAAHTSYKPSSERQDVSSAITLIEDQESANAERSDQQHSRDCEHLQRSVNMQAENSSNEQSNECLKPSTIEAHHGQGKLEEKNNISSLRSDGGNDSSCQDDFSHHGALDDKMLDMELHSQEETGIPSHQPHPCVALLESESRPGAYCFSPVANVAGDPTNDMSTVVFLTDHEVTIPETTTSPNTDPEDVSMEISEEESNNPIDCVFTPDQDVEMDISEGEMPTENDASTSMHCPEITLITANGRNDTNNGNEQVHTKSNNINDTSVLPFSTECDTIQSNAVDGGSDTTMSNIEESMERTEHRLSQNVEETPQRQRNSSASDIMRTISIVAETTISVTTQGDDGDVEEETDDSSYDDSDDSNDSDDVVLGKRERVGYNITSRFSPTYETKSDPGSESDGDRIPGRKPGKVEWSAPRVRETPRMVRKGITAPKDAPPVANARPTVSTLSLRR
ncbi:hypothetical protein K440DRAFT_643302 [Wilcoxina mikolae CBS 423.85]|nr:hypothetical protein K440DRAFT_643302 [Wilcoxina mikolae CBS 423.85]